MTSQTRLPLVAPAAEMLMLLLSNAVEGEVRLPAMAAGQDALRS
jgi:hypothetical protein